MLKYFMKQQKSVPASPKTDAKSTKQGQALLEYVLILVIVFIGLGLIVAFTASSIGNVWSNTVFNLLGQTTTPQEPLEEAEFWELITAVASYTPEAVDLITNTPPNPTDVPTIGPSPTYTPTVPTATASNTPTAGPSPTPEDRNFGFPFSDDGNDDTTFQGDDFLDLFASGPWNAEYWSSGACSNGSIFNASTGDGGGAQATAQVDKINFPDSNLPDDYWQTDTDRPYPGISTDFCSRFENTITLEAKTYTFKYRKDDGVRVYIDGVRVIDDWNWSPNNDNWITFDWVNATAGAKSVRIVHRDTGGGARLVVQLTSGGQTSTDNCNWHLSPERYRSGPTSWHSDDDYAEYTYNLYCVMRLRGTIDLSGANNPFLEFYDAYDLDRNADRGIVGVSIAGSGVWNDIIVHEDVTNYAFQRQSYRLSSFTGTQGTVDYRGQQIEIRFVLQTDNTANDDGWWVDDISVYDRPDLRYVIGFFDDVEGAEYWVPNGTWARSSEHVRSGSYAWSDSPGGANYVANAETTLELNGRLDLTQGTVSLPQISFWHSYDLHTSTDAIYVELSTDLVTWTPLRSGPADTTDYIAQVTDSPSFVQEVVDIPPSYWGLDTIFVRFRLSADSNGQVDDGWWIDDIEFRNKPQDTIRANWCDDMETGTGNWIPGGDWATTPARSYDGNLSWTDSPGDYIHGSNTTLELKPYVDMSAPLTRPVFEFWHSWNITRYEGLYVEVSVDDGNSWGVVWSYTSGYGNRPFGFSTGSNGVSAHDYKYDNNQAWVRETIELSPYIGIPSASPGPSDPLGIRVRFRLDARSNSNVSDGWYIDSICVREVNDEPVRTIPFAEDFEAGSDNWLMTGNWTLSGEQTHGGANALSDSPASDYRHETYSYVELKPTIDLTTVTNPVLYFFERYALNRDDRTFVIIRTVDSSGAPIGEWEVARYSDQYRDTNLGWTRNETDISSYAGQYIRVRFMIDALYDGRVDNGWWVDDVQILDRDIAEAGFQYNGDPYFADLEVVVPGEWVFDHSWDTVSSFRDQGSGGNLGPGQWTVTWYNNVLNSCSSSAQMDLSSARNTTTENEINFNWGTSLPPGSGISSPYDYFGGIFRRTLAFSEPTTFRFVGSTNNGMRIYDNGSLVYEQDWVACGASNNFESSPYTFSAGVHNIEVHYYDGCCSAYINLGFAGASQVFHDSPSGDYDHETDTRVELEGEINLAGTTNPVMFWDEKYYIGSGDSIRVEVSNDGGFTWNNIYSRGSGDNNNWTERWVDLSSYSGQKINIRFRLDARSNSDVDDGWYIDNIRIFE